MEKSIRIPLIKSGDHLEKALELEGARFDVCQVNWPETFPYAPICAGRIARTQDAILVSWRVSGLGLTVKNEDDGNIWEDSCCEIFLKDPDCPDYYNIEVNAAGFLLVGRGPDRHNRVRLPLDVIARIGRISGVKAPVDNADDLLSWSLTVSIPYDVIGLDAKKLPAKLLGNIYKCGDKTAHPHFLSWNPVGTPKPDFHRPDFFGTFYL